MFAQARQSVASAFRRSAAAFSTARTGAPICQFSSTLIILSLLIVILITRIPTAGFPDLGHGNPNLAVPEFNSSTIFDLAELEEEGSLREEVYLILEGNLDEFILSTEFFPWLEDFTLIGKVPAFATLYHQARPILLNWSIRRIIYNPRLPAEEILPELLGFIGRREKYSSCAIVGNRDVLLEAEHGAAIDSHEAVFRLNYAAAIGGSTASTLHVGTKTSISFVNSNLLHLYARWGPDFFCNPYGDFDVAVVFYIRKPIHFLDVAACNATGAGEFLVTDPRFDRLIARIVKYYSMRRWLSGGGKRSLEAWSAAHAGNRFHYSSGMQAVVMAVGVCERVSLFGFGKAAYARHDYHTKEEEGEMQFHDYEAEYEFYRDLMEAPERIPFLSSAIGKFEFPPVVIHR